MLLCNAIIVDQHRIVVYTCCRDGKYRGNICHTNHKLSLMECKHLPVATQICQRKGENNVSKWCTNGESNGWYVYA